MESFFLSETTKYLYLVNTTTIVSLTILVCYDHLFYSQLFDKDNVVNQKSERYIFSTEGHIYKVTKTMRENVYLSEKNPSNSDIHTKRVHNNHTRLDQVIILVENLLNFC